MGNAYRRGQLQSTRRCHPVILREQQQPATCLLHTEPQRPRGRNTEAAGTRGAGQHRPRGLGVPGAVQGWYHGRTMPGSHPADVPGTPFLPHISWGSSPRFPVCAKVAYMRKGDRGLRKPVMAGRQKRASEPAGKVDKYNGRFRMAESDFHLSDSFGVLHKVYRVEPPYQERASFDAF